MSEETIIDAAPQTQDSSPVAEPNTTPAVVETPVTPIVADNPTVAEPEQIETVPKKRFNEVYFKLKQAERDLVTSKQSALTQKVAPDVTVSDGPPKLEDFDFDDGNFQAASIAYQVNKTLAERDKASVAEKAASEVTNAHQSFNQKAAQYAAANPGYEQAIAAAAGVSFGDAVNSVLMASENGPALDHHLLVNPLLVQELSKMTPIAVAMKLGQLETTLNTNKPVTQAPAPIDNVTGGGGTNLADGRYNENSSMEDYYAATMAHLKN